MAKGRTANAIRIFVAPQFFEHPCVVAWQQAGHMVEPFSNTPSVPLSEFDLILAPQAHLWNDMMWDMEKAVIAAGRKHKKVRLAAAEKEAT